MPSTLPPGDPAPLDGALPAASVASLGSTPFGVYLHVPFCATRCGYCDFNTYTLRELGGSAGADPVSYVDAAVRELDLARRVLGPAVPPVETVFFGGGTPTLLPGAELERLLGAVRERFGLADDVEVTTEANPETVTPPLLDRLRAAGFTRISLGMQSAVPHVLATLDRTHTPGRPVAAAREARTAGFEHVNLDLIYGTPGESAADWERTLDVALEAEPDHVSAYALVVEEGTRLARKVARGQLPAPDDDTLADRYLAADERLTAAGLRWYEVSNWARSSDARCRHNLIYWRNANWWGVGPGAHSHVGGVRWWNVKHPARYAARLAAGESPAAAREVLDAQARDLERVLLGVRLADGLDIRDVPPPGRPSAPQLVADGLLDPDGLADGRLVLTQRGRLLADAVVRELVA